MEILQKQKGFGFFDVVSKEMKLEFDKKSLLLKYVFYKKIKEQNFKMERILIL